MSTDFSGKVAVVTGSSGIGLGAAQLIAKRGGRVYLCGNSDAHNATAQAATAGHQVSVHRVDVTQADEITSFINTIGAQEPGIDILINAAAIQTYGTVETTDQPHWDKVIATNLTAYYLMSRAVYPLMKSRGGGAIIHVSSVQGHANQNNVLAYATTKGAVHAMTRAMAVDCAKDRIRVNSISPGSIRTPLLEFAAQQIAGEGEPIEDIIGTFGQAHPIGRVGTVEETGELIAFLAGDAAGFCTGGDYLIDGGLMAQLGV